MKNIYTILVITGIAFAIFTRIILPYQYVFANGAINFNTVDAYFMVRQADLFPYWQQWDNLRNFPNGTQAFAYQVFPLLIVLTSKFNFVSNDFAAAWIPPILFFLTLIPVYIIARELFDNNIAAESIFILCLMPGEILYRTSLGAADYHCWEIFLITCIFCLIILAIKYKHLFYIAFSGLIFIIYWFSWQGAIITPFIILITILVYAVIKKPSFIFIALLIMIILSMIFKDYAMQGIGIIIPLIYSNISETQSLFFTNGQLDLSISIAYFGIGLYFIFFGIGWLTNKTLKNQKPEYMLFLIWSIIMLLATISMRRFDYYFAINAVIILAYTLSIIIDIANKFFNIKYVIVVLAIIIYLPLIRQSIILSLNDDYYITPDWQNSCQWLKKDNSKEYAILTHADYGYWIAHISNKPTFSDPGLLPSKYDVILTMSDYEKAKQECIDIKAKYIIIDKSMLTERLSSIMYYSNNVNLEDTFMYYLYNNCNPAYQSNDVKIYQMY